MRILFTIHSLACGGQERMLTELMKAIKLKPDIEFELVLMSDKIHYKEVFDLGVKIHLMIRKTKKDVAPFYKFYKLCKKYKPDLVHCWDNMTAVYLIPACNILKIKLVNGVISNSPSKQNIFNKHWIRAKLTFPFSAVIVGNSKAGLMAYNAPKNKSLCIYNGFDFDRTNDIINDITIREQLGINTKYVIGMVASFSEKKDYKTYFLAAQLILKQRKDVTFLAIGSETDSVWATKLIHDNYRKYFRLLGRQSNIESYINIMDVCILATFTEGISNSILEYMALEKPVIATSGGGTNELLKDQITGFLVSPSNPKEVADKMEKLLNDAKLRIQMGLAGKDRIEEYFSIQKMANSFMLVYEKLLLN